MKNMFRRLALLLTVVLTLTLFAGCAAPAATGSSAAAAETAALETLPLETEAPEAADPTEEAEEAEEPETEALSAEVPETEVEEAYLDPDGSYSSKDEVALYIHLYGELPGNFLTKKQAQKLGWSGGSLEQYAPGKSIGGSYFGNNEGLLPDNEYHECDIDTVGQKKRGAKRIVFSEDGYIYYTEDHYESFVLLYTPDGPVTDEIVYDADGEHITPRS